MDLARWAYHQAGPAPPARAGLTAGDRVLAAFLALFLLGVYLVTFDGTLHSTDGLSMLAVAENLVKHGHFDTRQLENWESARLGVDGRPHTVFPLGPTLLILPVYALALALPGLGLVQTTLVLMPLASALALLVLYLATRRLGYPPATGLVVTLLAGLATMTWLRTRDLVADPFILLGFNAAFYYALAYRHDKQGWQAGLLGLVLGALALLKTVYAAVVPFFLWYALVPGSNPFQVRRREWRTVFLVLAPVAAGLAIIGWYNTVRFGSPLDSGYSQPYAALMGTPLWVALAGYIINPYKSLFLYVPLFILIPFTLKKTWQVHSRETALILALLAGHLVIFGSFYDWGGGRNWGPRYLAPLNSLLLLLLLPFIHRAIQPGAGWPRRLLLAVVGLASLFMQILGISARDDVFLGAADYWTPPPNLSLFGELRPDAPERWPIWGHWLLFDPARIPTIWRWQWADLSHFDGLALVVLLLVPAAGLAGLVVTFRRGRMSRAWPVAAWLLAAGCAGVVLLRSHDDPRLIQQPERAIKLWQDYSALVKQLPDLVAPGDAVIFTDRRFEFYLLDTDRSPAQRYVIAKPNRPETLAAAPRLWQDHAGAGRLWLVTDELDNRQLAYATELWLRERGRVSDYYRFGRSLQLAAFELPRTVSWEPIPPEPQLAVLVRPDDFTFRGIASLLGWDWPGLTTNGPPRLQAGQAYPFELYWLYRGKDPADRFFIRLLAGPGRPVAEVFTSPRPGQNLVPGQLWIEDARLVLPAGLPAGPYFLQIGVRTPAVAAGELIFALPAELVEVQVIYSAAGPE